MLGFSMSWKTFQREIVRWVKQNKFWFWEKGGIEKTCILLTGTLEKDNKNGLQWRIYKETDIRISKFQLLKWNEIMYNHEVWKVKWFNTVSVPTEHSFSKTTSHNCHSLAVWFEFRLSKLLCQSYFWSRSQLFKCWKILTDPKLTLQTQVKINFWKQNIWGWPT